MTKRTIPLTDDQYERLSSAICSSDVASDIIGKSIVSAAELVLKEREKAWETVRRLSDTQPGESVKIDWVNRCIVVSDQDVGEASPPPTVGD